MSQPIGKGRPRSRTIVVEPWAKALEERRIELGLTQEVLADKANVTQDTISRLETGKKHPLYLPTLELASYMRSLNWSKDVFLEATGLDPMDLVELDGPSLSNQAIRVLRGIMMKEVPKKMLQGVSPQKAAYLKVDGNLYISKASGEGLKNIAHCIVDTGDTNYPFLVVLVKGHTAIIEKEASEREFVVLEPLYARSSKPALLITKDTEVEILGGVLGRYTFLGPMLNG